MSRTSGRSRGAPSSRRSIEAVYDEHVWRVYGFFAYRVDSRSDAEDLTQATFERAVRAYGRYDESRASVATWLLAIAQNLLIDHYRRNHGKGTDSIGEDGVHSDRLGQLAGPETDLGLDHELAAALADLTPRDREIVALRFGGDLTGPEIAEVTGLTLANVQQVLSRALRRMRAFLERADVPND
ncbi:MAG: RNA polymerase sigma factor [Solirubrobacterales bacterium]|nr:RNA polymerase sigma factor [Solirubrobacterales bacterium]